LENSTSQAQRAPVEVPFKDQVVKKFSSLLGKSHNKGGPVDPLTKFEWALELMFPEQSNDQLMIHPILIEIMAILKKPNWVKGEEASRSVMSMQPKKLSKMPTESTID